LYHLDAHEKLAKVWGFWIHGAIDGYSRKIIYLRVSDNKRSETVEKIFLEAMNDPALGWALRCRWDKGKENLKAVIAQLKYWIDAGVQNWETRALLGLSTQNCRIESLWKHVREQVCDFFSSTFHSMAQQGIYCPSSEIDRWYLHQTFLPLIQNALDEFTVLWNAKNIRGPPTEKGHGGGVPNELFQHPVHPDIADQDFKEFPGALDYDVLRGSRHQGRLLPVHTGMYGASDPHDFDNPDEESLVETLHLTDPLQGCKQMCRVREYFLKSDQPEWTQYEVTPHTPKKWPYLASCREISALEICQQTTVNLCTRFPYW